MKGKPVRELVGFDFLKLHIAEEDKLLKISFDEDIEGLTTASYFEEMGTLYTKVSFVILKILAKNKFLYKK